MAAEKIVYLVTSGGYDEYQEEAVLATPELAAALAAKVTYGEVHPMPVLDYVPERVTIWTYLIRLDPFKGWEIVGDGTSSERWDFEAPKTVPSVTSETYEARRWTKTFPLQNIHVSHRDRSVARETAEAMLARLRAESGPPGARPE